MAKQEIELLRVKHQELSGNFKTYYSIGCDKDFGISSSSFIESPGLHSVILEEFGLNKDCSKEVNNLLNSVEDYNGTYVWRFSNKDKFDYPSDFDDTAVAMSSLLLNNWNNHKVLENYYKLIDEKAFWISEDQIAIPTYIGEKNQDAIDFTVNLNILYSVVLSKSQEGLERKLTSFVNQYLTSTLFDKKIENVSKYYLYDSFATYIFSKIQKIKPIFSNDSIERVENKLRKNKPKNILDASLGSLTFKNLEKENFLFPYLRNNENKSQNNYALFRWRKGNIYFGSPLLTSLVFDKAMKK